VRKIVAHVTDITEENMARLVLPPGALRAVLLDVDGTLYDPTFLRLLMAGELCLLLLTKRSCRAVLKTWRIIAGFRAVRENLRSLGNPEGCLASLQAGDSVELRGFGRFYLRHCQARAGRNPRTGQTIPIPAKAVPTFTAGKAFQEQVQPRAAAGGAV
jgi:hypothetical protein